MSFKLIFFAVFVTSILISQVGSLEFFVNYLLEIWYQYQFYVNWFLWCILPSICVFLVFPIMPILSLVHINIVQFLCVLQSFFSNIFSWWPAVRLFEFPEGSVREWWFRCQLDRYAVLHGAVFSFLYMFFKRWVSNLWFIQCIGLIVLVNTYTWPKIAI